MVWVIAINFLFGHPWGALPPLQQSLSEIEGLLNEKDLTSRLKSGEVIEAILRTENGFWVVTQDQWIAVDVEYVSHPNRLGPKSFRYHVHEPISARPSKG